MWFSLCALIVVGLVVGVTTVLFGFGGGFVTVPVIAVVDVALGPHSMHVATATSALVMLVNAAVATAATDRDILRRLSGRSMLFLLLAAGGALGALAGRFTTDAILRWGFVVYIGVTIVDLLLRPGFLRRPTTSAHARHGGVPDVLGAPIGAVAAFLGVGGSVMTVPLMRRSGSSMHVATALANPLTLVIVAPALAVSLLMQGGVPQTTGLIGSVDALAAAALLIGAIPVIVLLRRRPPRIPDAVHAWTYIGLLVLSAGVVLATSGHG